MGNYINTEMIRYFNMFLSQFNFYMFMDKNFKSFYIYENKDSPYSFLKKQNFHGQSGIGNHKIKSYIFYKKLFQLFNR